MPLDESDNRHGVSAIGRLRPGVDPKVAASELDSLSVRAGVFPGQLPHVATVLPPAQTVRFYDSLLLLTWAVVLVLLVACANVAHLLVARGVSRRREFAVRTALGAARGRLLRQLVTESLVLSVGGTTAGVFLGWLGLNAALALRPSSLYEMDRARLDLLTLFSAIAVTSFVGLVFGALGALQAARQSPGEALKTGSLAASSSRRGDRLRSVLVISEMAVSAVLLVGASLLIRSVINIQRTDLGFSPKGLYGLVLQLPSSRYPSDDAVNAFASDIVRRLRAVPGVQDVALSSVGPYGSSASVGTLEVEGEPVSPKAEMGFVDNNSVQPSYFRVMGIRIAEGSTFSDTTEHSKQVIVNAGFARKHWPVGQAVGRRLRIAYAGKGEWLTVVGIAADALTKGVGGETTAPFLYRPWNGGRYPSVMFRVAPGIKPIAAVSAMIRAADPRLPPTFVGSMEAVAGSASERPRFTMSLLSAFTMLAVMLAAVGLYGTMAYSVSQRTREIGIRVALGATEWTIGRAVISRAAVLATLGTMIGLGGAIWATRLLETQVYGIKTLDVPSFLTAAAVLLVTAMVACVVPTRRALSVDIASAIRAD
jgi:putative ABC transport system permease protein